MIRISIITPSFNQARFIGRTIESIHSQAGRGTSFDLEHIVMDGGSTDGTVDLLRQCGSRLLWTSQKDDGQADALNKALATATGDVVGWLNSDDVYEPGALQEIAGIFEAESQTQWLYGKVRIIDVDDREIRRWITRYKDFRMRRFSMTKLLAENWISQMGVFWRRYAGQLVGPFRTDLHYCMDYNYWLRLGERWPGRFVDRYLAAFRWYPSSKSGAGFSKQFAEELAVASEIAAGRHPLAILRHRLTYAKIVLAYHMLRMIGK